MQPYIRLENVGKVYDTKGGTVEACAELHLDIRQSEFVAIVGPSGCGKTTLLKMVAGLVPPSSGRIAVDSVDITALPSHQRNMGLVFQNYALFPHLSVARNVAFGLEMKGMAKTERDAEIQELWKRLTDSEKGEPSSIDVLGRRLMVPQAARGAAFMCFSITSLAMLVVSSFENLMMPFSNGR